MWFKILSVDDKTIQVGYYTENSDFEVTGHGIVGNYSGHVTIPSKVNGYSVVSISDWAFLDCDADFSVTVPSSVNTIGDGAFENCVNLHSISLPNNVSIGSYAFEGCTSLKSIIIPEGVSRINDRTFRGCTSLSSVLLPTSITKISSQAFYGCRNLEILSIPKSVNYIGENAFLGTLWYSNFPDGEVYINTVFYKYKGSMPVKTSITIKDGTTSISPNAFYKQTSLFSCAIPNSVKEIGAEAFYGCTGLYSISLPDNLEKLNNKLFYKCNNLYSIILPTNLQFINGYVFYGCSSLSSIRIPSNVSEIKLRAFEKCTSLSSVTLPAKLSRIASKVFIEDTNIKEIISYMEAPIKFTSTDKVFETGIMSSCKVKVPFGSKNIYENTTGWKSFKNISEFIIGDANQDSCIDVSDLSGVVILILDNNDRRMTFCAADMDGNGLIEINDFAALVNVILNQTTPNSAPRLKSYDIQQSNVISLSDLSMNTNGEGELYIRLMNNDMQYTGMQFDLYLPEEIELMDGGAEVLDNQHGAWIQKRVDGTYRVICASITNRQFLTGDILRLQVKFKGTIDSDSEIVASNIILSDVNAVRHEVASARTSLNDVTCIHSIDNGPLKIENRIYNIAGQRVLKMQKGIYIVNGKRVVIR